MQDIKSFPICQGRDLRSGEVCLILGVSPSWLVRNRSLFVFRRMPGRGRPGKEGKTGEYRFDADSVYAYRLRLFKETQNEENPYKGKTIREIAEMVNSE